MNKATARALKLILAGPDNRLRPSLSSFLAQQLKRSPVKPIQREREAKDKAKRLGRNDSVGVERRFIEYRAGGVCEARAFIYEDEPFYECSGALEMDEYLGGWGRRRKSQNRRDAWLLCRRHHELKTRNSPSVRVWNSIRLFHCSMHSLAFKPRLDKHAEAPRG